VTAKAIIDVRRLAAETRTPALVVRRSVDCGRERRRLTLLCHQISH